MRAPQPEHVGGASGSEPVHHVLPDGLHFLGTAGRSTVLDAAPDVPVAVELVKEADQDRLAVGRCIAGEGVDVCVVFVGEPGVERSGSRVGVGGSVLLGLMEGQKSS